MSAPPDVLGRRRLAAAIGGTAALAIGILALVEMDRRHGTLRDAHVPQTVVWYLIAFAGFIAVAVANEQRAIPRGLLWAVGAGLRLALVFTTPTLSDDVYRYLWDGHLIASGVSPYRFAIADPLGDAFDIPLRALANNPELSSPYLPVANVVFGLLAVVAPSTPSAMQLLMVGLDLVTAALLLAALRATGLPERRVLLWLWNPLVIVEIAHGAHLDALMLALMMAAIVSQLRRPAGAGSPVLVALATLTRPIPGFATVALLPRWSWRQRALWLATLVAVCVPFGLAGGFGLETPSSGTGLFGSARVYSESFRFNSAIYQSAEAMLATSGAAVRFVFGAAFAVVAVAVMRQSRRLAAAGDYGLADVRLLVVPVVAYCVLTPVFHPWYLLIVVALAIFHTPDASESPQRWWKLAPLVWLSAVLVLTYLTYVDPAAHAERLWVRRVVWWPTLALSAAVWLRLMRRDRVGA